jgi:hypothetical protein
MLFIVGVLLFVTHALAFWLGHCRGVRQCRRMARTIVGMMLADPKIHIQR